MEWFRKHLGRKVNFTQSPHVLEKRQRFVIGLPACVLRAGRSYETAGKLKEEIHIVKRIVPEERIQDLSVVSKSVLRGVGRFLCVGAHTRIVRLR